MRGVALAVVLILLVVIATLALSGSRLAILELRMAAHEEARLRAMQQAQSLVDVALMNPANTPALPPGREWCARDCGADNRIVLPPDFDASPAAADATPRMQVRLRRARSHDGPPPSGSGFGLAFAATSLLVEGRYEGPDHGSATIAQTVAVIHGGPDVVVIEHISEL
jgi:hypothetical protein